MIHFSSFIQKKKNPRKTRKNEGYSILQVVIAIVIFAMTMSTTVSLVGTVIQQVAVNKNRITAIYLAQECLELVRNVRDTSWKQNYPWDCAFGENYSVGDSYTIEAVGIIPPETGEQPNCQKDFGVKITPFPLDAKTTLFITNNRYTHKSKGYRKDGEETIFQRKLILDDIQKEEKKPDQITITCAVSWDDEEIRLSEILSNWRKK